MHGGLSREIVVQRIIMVMERMLQGQFLEMVSNQMVNMQVWHPKPVLYFKPCSMMGQIPQSLIGGSISLMTFPHFSRKHILMEPKFIATVGDQTIQYYMVVILQILNMWIVSCGIILICLLFLQREMKGVEIILLFLQALQKMQLLLERQRISGVKKDGPLTMLMILLTSAAGDSLMITG